MPLLDTVENHLGVNEKRLHVARLSGVIMLFPFTMLIIGTIVLITVPSPPLNSNVSVMVDGLWSTPARLLYYPAELLCGLSIWHLIKQWIIKMTTSITVTNDRVVHEGGLIFRFSDEMSRGLIVGASIQQSVLGRILNYANVYIKGVGGGVMVLRSVRDPHTLHKKLLAIRKRTSPAHNASGRFKGEANTKG